MTDYTHHLPIEESRSKEQSRCFKGLFGGLALLATIIAVGSMEWSYHKKASKIKNAELIAVPYQKDIMHLSYNGEIKPLQGHSPPLWEVYNAVTWESPRNSHIPRKKSGRFDWSKMEEGMLLYLPDINGDGKITLANK